MSAVDGTSGLLAQRAHVSYPRWMTGVGLAIFVVQAAKAPVLNAFAVSKANAEPGLRANLSEETFRMSIYVGVGVLLLFSAVIGSIVFFSVAKTLYKRARDKTTAFEHEAKGILASLAFALIWPDLWSFGGQIVQPLIMPLYWLSHVVVVVAIARVTRSRAKWLKHLAICLGVSMMGVLT